MRARAMNRPHARRGLRGDASPRRPRQFDSAWAAHARSLVLAAVLALGLAGCHPGPDQWAAVTPRVRPPVVTLKVWWVAPTHSYPVYLSELARYLCHEPATTPSFQAMVRPYRGVITAGRNRGLLPPLVVRALVPKGLVVAVGDRVEIRSGDEDFCRTGRLTHVVRIVRQAK